MRTYKKIKLLIRLLYYGDLLKIKTVIMMRTCLNTLKENVAHVVLKKEYITLFHFQSDKVPSGDCMSLRFSVTIDLSILNKNMSRIFLGMLRKKVMVVIVRLGKTNFTGGETKNVISSELKVN